MTQLITIVFKVEDSAELTRLQNHPKAIAFTMCDALAVLEQQQDALQTKEHKPDWSAA